MNIFFTHINHKTCAEQHCTVHVRKMIVEYAQMLSTSHRILDGRIIKCVVNGKIITWHRLSSDEIVEYDSEMHLIDNKLYSATHANHPCSTWVRESEQNYNWLYECYYHLCRLYSIHAGRYHATSSLQKYLVNAPQNIKQSYNFTFPPQCVPEDFKNESTLTAYKNYLNYKYNDWINREKRIEVDFFLQKPKWCDCVI